MSGTKVLILLGLGIAVCIIVWLTPTRTPNPKSFRGEGGDPGSPPGGDGCD